MFLRYSLENYTSNNTSTTRHNMRQHEYNTTQHECNTTQCEYKGSSGSKNKALLCTFVTELFVFLISSRNCNHSPTYNIISTLWIPRLIMRPSEMLSNHGCMKSCAELSGRQDIKLKIANQVPKKHIYPLFSVLSATTTASQN